MWIDRASHRRLCAARDVLAAEDDAPIAEVARRAGISPFHFIRQFDALFGETPHQYRTRARLERAKRLLARGHSVTETCMEVGFSSLGSFSQLFTTRVGVSPSAFRRQVQVQYERAPIDCFSLMVAALSQLSRSEPRAIAAR